MKFQLKDYKKTNIIIRWLLFLVLLNIGISGCLRLYKNSDSSIRFISGLARERTAIGDSWTPMIESLTYFDKNPRGPVYDSMLFKKLSKFIYPPSSLLIFDLPHRILDVPYWTIAHWLDLISLFGVLLIGIVSAAILINLLKNQQFEKFRITTKFETATVYFVTCLLTILFYPITFSYIIGQIQTLLVLFVALSILCWQLDKKYLSGILIGIICLIKPQLILLLVWAIIRKQWKMIMGSLIVIIPFLFISIAFYGLENHIEYLSVLSFLSHHGETYYPNQSVNGLMNRLLFNGPNLTWMSGGYPPYSPIVYATTMISTILLILPALFWNYKKRNPDVMDMSLLILTATIASPIAWEHHYGIVLPIFMVIIPFAAYFYGNKKWALLILSFGFALVAQFIVIVKQFADSRLNILQSYLLFGACIILAFLYRLIYLEKKAGTQPNNNLSENSLTIQASSK